MPESRLFFRRIFSDHDYDDDILKFVRKIGIQESGPGEECRSMLPMAPSKSCGGVTISAEHGGGGCC